MNSGLYLCHPGNWLKAAGDRSDSRYPDYDKRVLSYRTGAGPVGLGRDEPSERLLVWMLSGAWVWNDDLERGREFEEHSVGLRTSVQFFAGQRARPVTYHSPRGPLLQALRQGLADAPKGDPESRAFAELLSRLAAATVSEFYRSLGDLATYCDRVAVWNLMEDSTVIFQPDFAAFETQLRRECAELNITVNVVSDEAELPQW